MTVMLYDLAEIGMEMSLLEMGVQLMTTYNFFLYNECHPTLVFRVFSVIPEVVSRICDSFTKPCPSDLGEAQDVLSIAF